MIGQELSGRYRVESKLGQGTVATVYRALDLSTQRLVAVKVFNPSLVPGSPAADQLLDDAERAAALGHPNLVPTLDVGVCAERFLFTVEPLLDGRDLGERMRDPESLDTETSERIITEVLAAVQALHESDVLHLDIKPTNVFLVRDALGIERAALSGAGIRHALNLEAAGPRSTKVGASGEGDLSCLAKAEYLTPEAAGGKSFDVRSDIYLVGLLMYELLAGRPPFQGGTLAQIAKRHVYEKPPGLRIVRPSAMVPEALEAVVMRCLNKSPGARYAHASDLRGAVDKLRAGSKPGALRGGSFRALASSLPPAERAPSTAPQAAPVDVAPAPAPRPTMMLSSALIGTSTELTQGELAPAETSGLNPAEPEVAAKVEPEVATKVEPEVATKVEPEAEPEVAAKVEPEVAAKVEPEVAAKVEPEVAAKVEPEVAANASPEATPFAAAPEGSPPSSDGNEAQDDDAGPSEASGSKARKRDKKNKRGRQEAGVASVVTAPHVAVAKAAGANRASGSPSWTESAAEHLRTGRTTIPPGGSHTEDDGWFVDSAQQLDARVEGLDELNQRHERGLFPYVMGGVVALVVVIFVVLQTGPADAPAASRDEPSATAPSTFAAVASVAAPLPSTIEAVASIAAPPSTVTAPASEGKPTAAQVAASTAAAAAAKRAEAEAAAAAKRAGTEAAAAAKRAEAEAAAAAKRAGTEAAAAAKRAEAEAAAAAKRAKAEEKAAAARALAASKPPTSAPPSAAPAARPAGPAAAALVAQGKALVRDGSWSEARKSFQGAATADPRNAAAHAGLGEVAFQEQKFAEAVKHELAALKLAPRNADYLVALGQAYFKLDRYPDAKAQWEKAIGVQPGNEKAAKFLRLVEKKMND